jgi:hypothetical protein
MNEVFMPKPDSRITIKEIYEAFQAWVVAKYGYQAWNEIGQRQVYAALKSSQDYQYVRFREGYCLKGIAYRDKPVTTTFVPPKLIDIARQKSPPTEIAPTESAAPKPALTYLTLNIVASDSQILSPETPEIIETRVTEEIVPPRYIIPRPLSIVVPNLGRRNHDSTVKRLI